MTRLEFESKTRIVPYDPFKHTHVMNIEHARSGKPESEGIRWRAVLKRDGRFDDDFIFAVRTTGIYCRPSCPARRPKRENTVFFDSAIEAEKDGYRSCKRCHPHSASLEERRAAAVRKACAIVEAAEEPPRLNDLAAAVGLSPSHFHRQFKFLTGVTPKEYAAGKRVKRLQDRLSAGRSVADATYESGFGSSSRVYEASKATLGMTPAQYRAGGKDLAIRYTVAKSTLGNLLVGATHDGVCCIELGDSKKVLRQSLKDRFPAARLKEDKAELRQWVSEITRFLKTPARGLKLPLDIQGTAFQQRVWKALQAIPMGQTASYQDIAVAIGKPTAQRAVAQACGANKLALAIPCHRVVRTDGELGGYHWGVERKRRLLEQERQSAAKTGRRIAKSTG